MTAAIPLDADPLCRHDPELFFTELEVDTAKEVCRACPFEHPCLEYALAHSVAGVWGATDEDDRKAIRARLGIVPKPIVTNPYPPRQASAA